MSPWNSQMNKRVQKNKGWNITIAKASALPCQSNRYVEQEIENASF